MAALLEHRTTSSMDDTAEMAPLSDVHRRSIFTECIYEAERFKWIESEKAGRDLGEWAIKDWVRHHWWGYLRAKWLEHLQGNIFWIELDRGDYGLLRRDFTDHRQLLDQIVELLKDGHENLGVIAWAKRSKAAIEPVIQILEALDINSRRLVHQFDGLHHGS